MLTMLVKFLIVYYSLHLGVNPHYCLAVAHVESRDLKNNMEFRVGRLGKSKYYGPMGIHQDFRKLRPEVLENNIVAGVRALGRVPLERYNASCTQAYKKAIRHFTKKYASDRETKDMINFLSKRKGNPHKLFRQFIELKCNAPTHLCLLTTLAASPRSPL